MCNDKRLNHEYPHINQQRYRVDLTVKKNEFVFEIAEVASQTSAYRFDYDTQNMS